MLGGYAVNNKAPRISRGFIIIFSSTLFQEVYFLSIAKSHQLHNLIDSLQVARLYLRPKKQRLLKRKLRQILIQM